MAGNSNVLMLLVAATAISSFKCCLASETTSSTLECQKDELVSYKVIFNAYWDRRTFPRQYPEWRPPAHWSKLVGFSHSPSFHLFRMGQTSSASVSEFAESGQTTTLDKETRLQDGEGGGGALDGFTAPPIEKGVGRTQTKIFVDGNHTMVSLMSKLVPSPDWFVGLDSLNLCENGRFLDTVTVEADPLDAGTDNGFTFTSPNWPTTPPGVIFRITNTYPPHPAGSFHYPDVSSLPTIASFTFIKEKEYELSETFHFESASNDAAADADNDVLSMSQVNKYTYEHADEDGNEYNVSVSAVGDDDHSAIEIAFVPKEDEDRVMDMATEDKDKGRGEKEVKEEEREEEEKEEEEEEEEELTNEILADIHGDDDDDDDDDMFDDDEDAVSLSTNEIPLKIRHHHGYSRKKNHHLRKHFRASPSSHAHHHYRGQEQLRAGYHASTGPKDFLKKKYKSEYLEEAQDKIYDKPSLYEKIMQSYRESRQAGLSESLARKLKRKKLRRMRKKMKALKSGKRPRNCKVSAWGPWEPCSKTCGIGESVRSRSILKHPKRGGKACPTLKAVKWCGSARNCRGKYFDW